MMQPSGLGGGARMLLPTMQGLPMTIDSLLARFSIQTKVVVFIIPLIAAMA